MQMMQRDPRIPPPIGMPASTRRWGLLAGALLTVACGGRGGALPASQPEGDPVSRPVTAEDRIDPDGGAPFDDDGEMIAEETIAEEGFAGVPAPAVAPAPIARPRGTLTHTLRRGQTLYSVARRYGVPLDRLMRANGITDPTRIPAGTAIAIPGKNAQPAKTRPAAPPPTKTRPAKPAPPPVRTAGMMPAIRLPDPAPHPQPGRPPEAAAGIGRGGLALAWPIGGQLTASFGQRGRTMHEGIDIDGRKGQTVRAAAPGIVQRAGEDGKYGKVVVIEHEGGISTLYAHASKLLVDEGDRVERNDPIAEVGRTGNASGHHLHFEIRRDGRPVDPLPILRSGGLRPPRNQEAAAQ